jgi:hypothetical protein
VWFPPTILLSTLRALVFLLNVPVDDLIREEMVFPLIGTDMFMNVRILYQCVGHTAGVRIDLSPHLLLSPNAEFIQDLSCIMSENTKSGLKPV